MEDVLTTARQFSLFSVRSIQSKSNRPVSLLPLLILFFHISKGNSVILLFPDYPTKTLYVPLLYFVYPISPISLILSDPITRIISLWCKSHEIIYVVSTSPTLSSPSVTQLPIAANYP
jgi:hypothetical protein